MMLFLGWVAMIISATLNIAAMIKPGEQPIANIGAGIVFISGCVFLIKGYRERASAGGQP